MNVGHLVVDAEDNLFVKENMWQRVIDAEDCVFVAATHNQW